MCVCAVRELRLTYPPQIAAVFTEDLFTEEVVAKEAVALAVRPKVRSFPTACWLCYEAHKCLTFTHTHTLDSCPTRTRSHSR